MAKIEGNKLTITIGGASIDLLNSVSLSVSGTEIDCTNFDSGDWMEHIMGSNSWTMSGSAFVDTDQTQGFDETMTAFIAKTLVVVAFTTGVTAETEYGGSAYFTSIDQTGEQDSIVDYSFNLKGTGALTPVTIPA